MVQLIWGEFVEAQVNMFASPETSHCQLFYSVLPVLGTDALVHSWPRGLCKYTFPPVSLLAQTLCKVREDEEQVLLVAPYWPNRTWFPELGRWNFGCHRLDLPSTKCALPAQVACPRYERRGILLGAGSWSLADRFL